MIRAGAQTFRRRRTNDQHLSGGHLSLWSTVFLLFPFLNKTVVLISLAGYSKDLVNKVCGWRQCSFTGLAACPGRSIIGAYISGHWT